jgi:hypothetical protein
MIPNEKFKFETVIKGDNKVVVLRGMIDEDTTFTEMANLGKSLTFNWKGVTSINSCGVRNWVNFIKDLTGYTIHYEECPPLIVRQMNMIPSFVANASVVSVYAPYVCSSCENEQLVLIPAAKFTDVDALMEAKECESCKKGELELDGHPQQYFAFSK